jgi:pimeloyl-ACP methyl ester carboxylesterase
VIVNIPNGPRIAYERYPGEQPVLLLHGFASDAMRTWGATGWLSALAEAKRGVISVDLRGHGGSSFLADPDSYSPAQLASDVAAVLDQERVTSLDIVGYSMGSQIARQFASDFPARTQGLVLGGIGSSEPFGRWGAPLVRAAFLDGAVVDDPVLGGLAAAAASLSVANRLALAACAEGMAGHAVRAKARSRTMLVTGALDPVAAGAASLALDIGATWVSLPGRHHGSTLSARAFKQAALKFLGEAQ